MGSLYLRDRYYGWIIFVGKIWQLLKFINDLLFRYFFSLLLYLAHYFSIGFSWYRNVVLSSVSGRVLGNPVRPMKHVLVGWIFFFFSGQDRIGWNDCHNFVSVSGLLLGFFGSISVVPDSLEERSDYCFRWLKLKFEYEFAFIYSFHKN